MSLLERFFIFLRKVIYFIFGLIWSSLRLFFKHSNKKIKIVYLKTKVKIFKLRMIVVEIRIKWIIFIIHMKANRALMITNSSKTLQPKKITILLFMVGISLIFCLLWFAPMYIWKLINWKTDYFKQFVSFYEWISDFTQMVSPYTTKVLPIIIPLSLTFFYFVYKEQKSLALSSNTFWNMATVNFLLFSLIAIVIGRLLNNDWIKKEPDVYFLNNVSFLFIIIFVVLYGFLAIFRHLSNLNISNQLEEAINGFGERYQDLLHVKKEKEKYFYNPLNNSVETIYQLLFLALEKNMSNVYIRYVNKWEKVLSNFKDEPVILEVPSNGRLRPLIFSVDKNSSDFLDLFRSILKNQITLIMKLIQGNRIEDAQNAIKLFNNMCPAEQSLRIEFYTSLHELSVLCYKLDFLEPILNEISILQQYEKSKKKENGNVVDLILEKLLITALAKNDVKSVSSISYCATKNLFDYDGDGDGDEGKQKKNKKINKNKDVLDHITLPDPFSSQENRSDEYNSVLYMLFLTSIKSIELSHYAVSGFLIKFIVTNFNGGIIQKVFEVMTTNIRGEKYENPYVENSPQTRIDSTFNLNKKTVRYCVEKMSILLYCQQNYSYERGIKFNSKLRIKPFVNIEEVINSPYLTYILDKLENAKDKYGLYFLKETDYLKEKFQK
nr:hypothetical protein [Paenibacillus xylanexedens]